MNKPGYTLIADQRGSNPVYWKGTFTMSSATKGAEIVLLKLLVLTIAILGISSVACFKLSCEGLGVCQLHQSSWGNHLLLSPCLNMTKYKGYHF